MKLTVRLFIAAEISTRGPREIEDFVGWEDEVDGKAVYRR
jgi:hypothetical protein